MTAKNVRQNSTKSLQLNRTKVTHTSAVILLSVILAVFVLVPLITLLCQIDADAWRSVFEGGQFWNALLNSLTTTVAATVISVAIAFVLAWAISRTNIKCKGIFSTILVLPMLIPSISHGLGLINLYGNNGLLTRLFNAESHLYGYFGIIYGSVLYSFPVAFLMFVDIMKYEDATVYDAAEVLGISKTRQFVHITLPFLKKTLISVFFSVFTMIITDYGVPIAVGGKVKTLSVLLYENAAGQLNYSAGAVIGLFLLIPALVAFLIDILNKNNDKASFITKQFELKKQRKKDVIGYVICALGTLLVLSVLLPFCIQAFTVSYPSNMSFTLIHFRETIGDNNGWTFLLNSVLMSLITAFVGMATAFIVAYCTARLKTKSAKILHIISILTLSIPGLVLGLSYIIVFKSSFLYGTLTLLILANTVHFFASPYQMMYNALLKVNTHLEDVGHVLNVPRYRVVTDCIMPQCRSSLAESFSYFFVNSMMTISAVAFLSTSANQPLSLLINQFESYNMIECSTVVALLILAVNVIMKTIIYFVKKGGISVNKKSV